MSCLPALVQNDSWIWDNMWMLVAGILLLLLGILIFAIVFSLLPLWIQSYLTRAKIGILALVAMRLRRVDAALIVKHKIALVQAGVQVTTRDLEAHYLARGNVPKTAAAVIAAHKALIDLPWKTAAALDLAGRDILDAVRVSVSPRVIDCPDPRTGQVFMNGVCKNGIQLKARARVTVRTKLERLIGGAAEATIIARVGEGIVQAIGSAELHGDVLANPQAISDAVLNNSLDAQTAFEIVSIDIADIEVGENIGAKLQVDQAAADLRVAQAQAEKRRAFAVAAQQEMTALVEENKAKVVLAEAEIPLAIGKAFRKGQLRAAAIQSLKVRA